MKKVIILHHDGGEMGNQLWSYASIYAYCVEKGYVCENWSFFEYAHYFKNISQRNFILRLFFVTCHNKRMYSYCTRVRRRIYRLCIVLPISIFCRKQIVYTNTATNDVYYLSPTASSPLLLANLENSSRTIYFSFVSRGVFRNPVGMNKHRESIISYFSPAPHIKQEVHRFIDPLRQQYKILIGLHIRQTNYAQFKGGRYLVSQERARDILKEYCEQNGYSLNEVCFVIASDGIVNKEVFRGFNIEISTHNAGEDLFILSSCDVIVGSDSTFGSFASYYGDIPHVIMKNEPMDWDYYKDMHSYFINKYFTVMLN